MDNGVGDLLGQWCGRIDSDNRVGGRLGQWCGGTDTDNGVGKSTWAMVFPYDANQACLCAERGCVSGRCVQLDLTLYQPAPLASPLLAADLRALLSSAGVGPVPTLGRPSHWSPATRRPALAATLTAAVEAAWAADTLAGRHHAR